MRIYNTLSKKIEEIKTIEKDVIKMYFCGPTVYDFPHIGNLRTFVVSDILHRYLSFIGYKVIFVMNLTDVDDKTIRGATKEGITLREYTDRYANIFFENIKTMRIRPATYYPRATEHIEDIVKFIKDLIESKHAYITSDGVYFDISSFKDYGKLSKLSKENIKTGASGRVNVDEYSKEDVVDFALWKAWKKEDGDVFWETEIGKGRPGWHIECSVMSSKYLGETFDIHGGGVDLIFPHHENEIAQSEARSGKTFVNYWFHVEHLMINGRKMSKSEGNYFTLKDLLDKGYWPRAIRLVLISTHYRKPLDFTEERIIHAQNTVRNLEISIAKIKKIMENEELGQGCQLEDKIAKSRENFLASMNDDLNVPEALGHFFSLISEFDNSPIDKVSKKEAQKLFNYIKEVKEILDFFDIDIDQVPNHIKVLVEEREKARRNKDFNTSDKIRDEILSKGIILLDTKIGPIVANIKVS